jgi:uncharacterized protein YbjT (DUF2867 family)/membrane protease YdiL (CAAX protease family)
MTRRPDSYEGAGYPVYGDVHDPATLTDALGGCRTAYYLVHSLSSRDFERLDAEAARAFAGAAAEAGIEQIVYLGGLGSDDDRLSAHLRSRREVEHLLGSTGVPVTTLRAGIIVGSGGISWEITRQLVAHLPVMVTPKWVRTRTQPIAVDDVVRYLVGVLDQDAAIDRVFEVGGPDVLPYSAMLRRVARIQRRPLLIVPVPMLSPGLSARWLALVTDVDTQAGRSLVDSMANEVVVRDDSIRAVVAFRPMAFDEAVVSALREGSGDSSRRRRVVSCFSLAGTGLLAASMSAKPGSRRFYATTAALAATWTAGGLASGPLHRGWIESRDRPIRRPVLTPIATGVGAFGLFYAAARLSERIPALHRAVARALSFAQEGDDALVLATALANGVGEEIFFRGAVYAAFGDRHPVAASTAVYALATTSTRNPALVMAAAVMGGVFAMERRASGGVQAPMLTHLVWSALMIKFLPRRFAAPATSAAAGPGSDR